MDDKRRYFILPCHGATQLLLLVLEASERNLGLLVRRQREAKLAALENSDLFAMQFWFDNFTVVRDGEGVRELLGLDDPWAGPVRTHLLSRSQIDKLAPSAERVDACLLQVTADAVYLKFHLKYDDNNAVESVGIPADLIRTTFLENPA